MDLTVIIDGDDQVLSIRVEAEAKVETVKALVQADTGIAVEEQQLHFNQHLLADDQQTLASAGVSNHDFLQVQRARRPRPAPTASQQSSATRSTPNAAAGAANQGPTAAMLQDPAALQQYFRSQPALLDQLSRTQPQLAQAILSDTPEMLRQLMSEQQRTTQQREQAEQRRIRLLNEDPFSEEAQAAIEEEIRLSNVAANFESALEYNAESFATVIMLYVPCVVNGIPVPAFVDSGAQSTIMSSECAARCNLLRLLDKRYSGTAKGVGSAKILGRIHACTIQIGKEHFTTSITVLENQNMPFLLGLDNLKKHAATIDLKNNCLCIGDQKVPFMAEHELPKEVKEEEEKMEDVMKPPGMQKRHSSSAPGAAPASAAASTPAASAAQPAASTATQASNASQIRPQTSAATPASNQAAKPPADSSAATSMPSPAASMSAQSPAPAPSPAPSSQPLLPPRHGAAAAASSSPAVGPRPAAAAAAAASPAATVFSPSEASINTLCELGFSRDQSITALRRFRGNLDQAGAWLFAST